MNVVISNPQHTRAFALMLVSTLCFTANVLLVRAVGNLGVENVWLVSSARFVVGLVMIALVFRGRAQFGRVFHSRRLAARGLIGAGGVYVYYLTVVHLGAGRATFINSTYVIFSALLAVRLLRERFRVTLAVGSIGALLGLALLTNTFNVGVSANGYDLLALIGALMAAYVVITIRQLHAEGEHTGTIFAAQCLYGLLLCAAPAALAVHVCFAGWLLMLAAGVCSGAGQLAMTHAFRDLPVADGTLLQILVPLGTAAGGVTFFAERFSPHELVGAALILSGTAVTLGRRSAP